LHIFYLDNDLTRVIFDFLPFLWYILPMISSEKIYRIIDVNLNRATEGLRVIEDAIRFILNDACLWEEIRDTRHSLVKTVRESSSFDFHKLITSRDSHGDVGADFKEEEERKGIENLVRAKN